MVAPFILQKFQVPILQLYVFYQIDAQDERKREMFTPSNL